MAERCEAYARAFPDWEASWPRLVRKAGGDTMTATWVLGSYYRNANTLYGAYPHGYLQRLFALFPDVMNLAHLEPEPSVLHLFAGLLPADRRWVRLDANPARNPDVLGNVYDAASLLGRTFPLICADPIYSKKDAKIYGMPACDRRRATAASADVAQPGGHMAWLDTAWPMHNKKQWRTIGFITVVRSTNHRVRLCSIFERVGA